MHSDSVTYSNITYKITQKLLYIHTSPKKMLKTKQNNFFSSEVPSGSKLKGLVMPHIPPYGPTVPTFMASEFTGDGIAPGATISWVRLEGQVVNVEGEKL